ncbi:MAG: Transport system permease protein [Methanothrix harundinacea]|jgi:iron complex transport system permease protein|uniref:Cobalamin import system permease protein BtuC n=1 Tax=Methanothrix harundinacea TaxID=301375 RepID=A0A101IJ45_9EURY|nr:MAG: Transport system permease protein [Methanothrix harundinacea]
MSEDEVFDAEEVYARASWKKTLFTLVLFVAVALLAVFAISMGAASLGMGECFRVVLAEFMPVEEVSTFAQVVVLQLRLPRILMAIITGISLGVAGAVMQGVLRNPLVSPYTLGLSSGAACGAAIAIVLGVGLLGTGRYIIVINAFFFSLLTMAVVYGISRIKGTSVETLILAGVAMGYLFSAVISLLKYTSGHEELREVVFWLMGGLYTARWENVIILIPAVFFLTVLLMRYSWDLNAMSAGEEVAVSLGINVNRVRVTCLTLSTILTASVIAFTGVIGFIGLVSPHVCRLLIGNDHRYLIPCSGLIGALLLLASDTACRTMISPTEIPVGIVTSFIGVPFFLYLLVRRKRRWWQ